MFTKSQLKFLQDKKLALACSGGVDSMVLADCLMKHKIKFSLIHCNFQLRGIASEEDEKLVQFYAEKNNLTFYTKCFDTENSAKLNATSIEMEARNLRYNFFKELREKENFDLILLAHHQNDQAETIFMRLIKGAGLTGLSGMKELRDEIYFRPFLDIPKETILKYAREHKINFREDASNKENIYQRNQIRNQIIPLIEEINPSFRNALVHLGDLSSQTNDVLHDNFGNLKANWLTSGEVDLHSFSEKSYLPLIISYLLEKEILHKEQMKDILGALISAESKIFQLNSFEIEVKNFIISRIKEINSATKVYNTISDLCSDTDLKSEKINNIPKEYKEGSLYLDIEKLKFPVQFRPMQIGDKIKLYGMKGMSKKLSDIAQELRWTKSEKLSSKIFFDSDSEIIAILGYRISEKVKLDSISKHILIINSI